MTLYYHMKEPAVTVLGPGSRYCLWVQGCPRSCPGCVAGNTHRMEDGKQIETGALSWEIALSHADGLTISGGEPFLQAPALAELIKFVRQIRPMGVIVYTGYLYEELLQMPEATEFLSQIDLLIDGPYVRELDDHKGLRGSSNQRVIPLTDVYRTVAQEYHDLSRQQQFFAHSGELHAVGLPDNDGVYNIPNLKFSEIKQTKKEFLL